MKNVKKNGFIFNMLLLTIFFSIWFPKAGIKLSGIPLTVSNILFGLTFILWFFKKIIINISFIHNNATIL